MRNEVSKSRFDVDIRDILRLLIVVCVELYVA
jgi:hypothetical protein